MSEKDILDFCQAHDVEISFCFDKPTGGYRIRMKRGAYQIIYILSVVKLHASIDFSHVLKATLNTMLDKVDKAEKDRYK